MTVVTRHTYKAETDAGTVLAIKGGNITLDSSAVPYIKASLTIPYTDPAVLAELDPRDGSRVKISATRQGHVDTLYTPWGEQGRNRIPNPSFEVNVAGWTAARANLTRDNTRARDGGYSCKATITDASAVSYVINNAALADRVPVIGGASEPVRGSIWSPISGNAALQVYEYNAAGALLTPVLTSGFIPVTAGQWSDLAYTFTYKPTAATARFVVQAPSDIAVGQSYWVDRISVGVESYFDGSTNPAGELERTRWLGTANASASVLETRSVTGQEWVPENFRTFDLGIRTARPNRAAGTVELDLASDEALLVDHAPLNDIYIGALTTSETMDLRSLVEIVFFESIGATLEAGTENADVTPYFEVTNMLRNPAVVGSTVNWSAAGSCTIAYGSSGSSGYVRVIPNSGATAGAVMAIDIAKLNVPAVPGHSYTFTVEVRAETAGGSGSNGIQFYDRNGALISTSPIFDEPIGIATQTLTATAQAPSNAVAVAPFFRFASNRVYRLDAGLLYDSTDDTWFVPKFTGGDAPDGIYTYRFEGPSNDSASVRTPNEFFERSADTMNWRAGVSGLEFLRGLLMTKGFRLVCDEQRKWTLRKASFRNAGTQTWTYGQNLISLDEVISRDDDTWYEGAVYTSVFPNRPRRVDSYGLTLNPSKVLQLTTPLPFTGVGRAANVVERAQGMGRRITVTGIPTWTELTDQPLTVTLDDGTTLTGIAASVRFNLDDDTVTVTTRETEDV